MVFQLRARDDRLLVQHEIFQNGVFFGGQLDRLTAARDRMRRGVQRQVGKREHAALFRAVFAGCRTDPREQLVKIVRLDQIVVCPHVQPVNAVAHAVARGQEDHRRGLARRTHLPQHGMAVFFRHHDIKQHTVIVGAAQAVQRLFAVQAGVHAVSGPRQRLGDQPV